MLRRTGPLQEEPIPLPQISENMSLVTVGTVAFDAIQTPFASSGKIVGGAASYIGLSASQFAKEQYIISVIGDDFPQSFIAELESRGVNTEGLECRTGEKSFLR